MFDINFYLDLLHNCQAPRCKETPERTSRQPDFDPFGQNLYSHVCPDPILCMDGFIIGFLESYSDTRFHQARLQDLISYPWRSGSGPIPGTSGMEIHIPGKTAETAQDIAGHLTGKAAMGSIYVGSCHR